MNRMMYRGGQGGMGTIPGGPLGKAKFAMGSGRPDEAERICRKRLERYPDDTNTRALLAQALLQQQMPAEAAEEARQVIRAQSTNVDAHLVLSAALLQRVGMLGKIPAEAEQAARRAVQLQPKAAKTHVQLAEVLMANKDFAGARTEAEEACRLEPRLAGAHLIRALVLLSDKDPNGAIQASESALRYDRSLAQAEFIKANALIEVKRYDEAIASLDTAEHQNPMLGGANAQSMRGRIYFKQRKFGESYRQFRQIQMLSPRLRFLAPVIAAINMVLTGIFGQNAQYAWAGLLAVLIVAILVGISYIPVAGSWIVVALVLGLVAVTAFGYVRQTQGRLLPAALSARVTSIVAVAAATLASLALLLWLIFANHWWSPIALTVAGTIALALGALALYLFGRFGGATASA